MRKPNKEIELVCECGRTYTAKTRAARRCPWCRKIRKAEQDAAAKERMRASDPPKGKTVYTLQCVDCPAQFELKNPHALRCPVCRKAIAKKRSKEWQHNRSKKVTEAKRARSTKRSSLVGKSINEVMAELAAYNNAHGTSISYGKWVQMQGG